MRITDGAAAGAASMSDEAGASAKNPLVRGSEFSMTEPEAKRQAVEILRADANELAAWIDSAVPPQRIAEAVRKEIHRLREIGEAFTA